jgi:hypothetical protein
LDAVPWRLCDGVFAKLVINLLIRFVVLFFCFIFLVPSAFQLDRCVDPMYLDVVAHLLAVK